MSRSRQRRKERRAATNAPPAPPSPEDPGDKKLTADDVSMPTEEREAFDAGVAEQMAEDERQRGEQEDREIEAGELIEALDVLRASRANPLTAGIQVFTSMLEQARAGYAADRLAELEAAMSLDFNALEAQGIVQIAMANMDETGVPDVEHGVQLCIEARVEVAASEPVAEDHGDGEESQVDAEDDRPPLHSIVRVREDQLHLAGERAKVVRRLVDHRLELDGLDGDMKDQRFFAPDDGVEVIAESEGHGDDEIAAEEAEADKPGPED